jgi:hypothetical protein
VEKVKIEPRFTDNGDGTVTDNTTGLTWQQRDDGARRTWAEAMEYAKKLTLAGHTDWRLPTVRELGGIVDYSRRNPAIDAAFFPGTSSSGYWSSSSYAYNTYNAWIVYFNDGYVNYNYKTNNYYARCVRL